MCYHNIPVEIPYFDGKLYQIGNVHAKMYHTRSLVSGCENVTSCACHL